MKIFNIGEEKIYSFEWNLVNSNMYLVYRNNLALIVDPIYTKEAEKFLFEIKPQRITVLLTHEHFDHINRINWMRDNFDTEVCCSQACAERICSSSKNLSDKSDAIIMFNPDLQKRNLHIAPFECKADIVFKDEFLFNWIGSKISIISTPGHSPGSVCIFLDDRFVFTGDTLLEYQTITRLPGGNKKVFYEKTMPMLENLMNSDHVIFPGHGKNFKYGSI